jgi:hypothetical protein
MPFIEVSVGELLDKWSILEIKLEKLKKEKQQANIIKEMSALAEICKVYLGETEINALYSEMYKVNLEIWIGMDQLYEIKSEEVNRFVELTNFITEMNKKRAYLKKEIDVLASSQFSEEKSYF